MQFKLVILTLTLLITVMAHSSEQKENPETHIKKNFFKNEKLFLTATLLKTKWIPTLVSETWYDKNGKVMKIGKNVDEHGYPQDIEIFSEKIGLADSYFCETDTLGNVTITRTGGTNEALINGVITEVRILGTGSCRYGIFSAEIEGNFVEFNPNEGCGSNEYSPTLHRGLLEITPLKQEVGRLSLARFFSFMSNKPNPSNSTSQVGDGVTFEESYCH